MHSREHHRRVARLLQALDPAVLAASRCGFGGGTAIAMRCGEHRVSRDVDLIVSDRDGYRALRQRLAGAPDLSPILRTGRMLALRREIRADQYGIRTFVDIDGEPVKFEIVLEARIDLDPLDTARAVEGIATLAVADLVATKLLANSDRVRDAAAHGRDLLDLVALAPSARDLHRGAAKARAAYGQAIDADLQRSLEWLVAVPGRLPGFLEALDDRRVPAQVLRSATRLVRSLTAGAQVHPAAAAGDAKTRTRFTRRGG